MNIPIDANALARRIAILDEIGVGPLWLRRSAMADEFSASVVASSAPVATPSSPEPAPASAPAPAPASNKTRQAMPESETSSAAAWDDGALHADAAAAPVKTVLTLCSSANVADTTRYLFVARASGMQGADALFENILLALGMRKEAEVQGELAGLREQVAAHRPSVLIAMGQAVGLEAGECYGDGEGSDGAFESLRGRLHRAGDLPLLVTYDAMHLLRNPIEKRKAWDDLCLLTRLQAPDVADPA